MDFDKRLEELFLDLPEAPSELGMTANAAQAEKMVYLSGAFPFKEGKMAYKGRLGLELTADNGKLASHTACMQAISILRTFLGGSLNKVKKIVMMKGYVASGAEFREHAKVLDGASQLITDVFGNAAGRHARSAIGVNVLPNNAAVEIELIVEVK